MILKNEIPILEFDMDSHAVIEPSHENLDMRLPSRAVYAFLGDYIDIYARSCGAKKVGEFISATKLYPVYVLNHLGEDVVLMQAPVGAAAAAQIMDWLLGYGVSKLVSTGTCGALQEFPEGAFLIPAKALRDEGTSYHYAPPSRYIELSEHGRRAIRETMEAHGPPYQEVITWSTDGFFRETREKVAYRKAEGCSVVEMECSALAACAALRGAEFGMILYTADSLANAEHYDTRSWGGNAYECALELCLDAVLKL